MEVLVTLLVLSFGVLAGAVLQLQALQATHSAYQHSLASVLATDAGERLWVGLAQGQIDTDWLADWRERRRCETVDPHVCLPALEITIEPFGTGQRITLSWAEARFADEHDGRAERDYRLEVLPERVP